MQNFKIIGSPTGFPVGDVNLFLFIEPEPVLIDVGVNTPMAKQALVDGLANYGLTLRDLSKVIISHQHFDHLGLAKFVFEASDADFYTLSVTKPWLSDYPMMWQRQYDYYQQHLFPRFGLSEAVSDPILAYYRGLDKDNVSIPAERIHTYEDRAQIDFGGTSWEVLHTPGHSTALACYFHPKTGTLLSTDMLLHIVPTPIIDAPVDGAIDQRPSPLQELRQSLSRLNQMPITEVFPSHGESFSNHQLVIQQQLNRMEKRAQTCYKLIADGHSQIETLLLKMYPHYPPAFRFAGLWMLVGYLDLLRLDGKIQETVADDGAWQYLPV